VNSDSPIPEALPANTTTSANNDVDIDNPQDQRALKAALREELDLRTVENLSKIPSLSFKDCLCDPTDPNDPDGSIACEATGCHEHPACPPRETWCRVDWPGNTDPACGICNC
jgi:hypothetical protein